MASTKSIVLVILSFIAIALISYAFYYAKKIPINTLYMIIGGAFISLIVYFLLSYMGSAKSVAPIVTKRVELSMDVIKKIIKRKSLQEGWARGYYTNPSSRLSRFFGFGREEQLYVPNVMFTGNQRIYAHRGGYRALIEARFKDPDSPIRGLRTFDIPLSKDLKTVESGNFTMLHTDILNFTPDYRNYPPEIAVSRLSQEISEISQSLGVDIEKAREIAQSSRAFIPTVTKSYKKRRTSQRKPAEQEFMEGGPTEPTQ